MSRQTHSRFTVIIADDEPPARHGIRSLLADHPDFEVIAEARSGGEATDLIGRLKPDLVFLDVQMPEGDGFEVVRSVGVERMPVVVFATAYDSYALQAFEANAVDYLLKPYDRERFAGALQKVRSHLRRGDSSRAESQLRSLLEQVENSSRFLRRITVRTGNRLKLVDVPDVDYFEAEANYVRLHVSSRTYLVRETLTSLESRLDPSKFLRVHRALIVQLDRIAEVESLLSGEYVLFLRSGQRLTTGRTYRATLQNALNLRG